MSRHCAFLLLWLCSFTALAGPPAAPPPAAAVTEPPAPGWEFLVTLPGWAAGLRGDVGVGGFNPVSVDVPFKDILSNLDMAAMMNVEARHRRWGLILDGIYLRMSMEGETPGRLLTSVDVEVEQVLAEIALAYRLLEGERGYLDILAGARYVYVGSELNFHLDSAGVRDVSNDLSNAIVDRAVDAIQREVGKTAARVRTQLAALNLDDRAQALRDELRTGAVEKILEEHALRDIIQAIRDLTPAQRELIRQKIENSREIIAANKALAQAVIQERVASAVAAARKKAQQAVARARRRLSSAIESAIRDTIPDHVSASKSWVDPFVGFRARCRLTDKLYLAARADIGGFGVGSDLAWNAFAALGYQWTPSFSTELGYRHLAMDYRDGGFVFDAEMSGVYLGMTIRL